MQTTKVDFFVKKGFVSIISHSLTSGLNISPSASYCSLRSYYTFSNVYLSSCYLAKRSLTASWSITPASRASSKRQVSYSSFTARYDPNFGTLKKCMRLSRTTSGITINLGNTSSASFSGLGISLPSSSNSGGTSSTASTGVSLKISYVTPWPGYRILSTKNLCSALAYAYCKCGTASLSIWARSLSLSVIGLNGYTNLPIYTAVAWVPSFK